jgi:hypothetical protein
MHPTLKAETDVTVIWYQDLADAVEQLYGQKIDLLDTVPFELLGQNTFHDFVVDGTTELDIVGDPEIVGKWIETGQITNIDVSDVDEIDWKDTADVEMKHILHRLFKEGHIPAGKYIITVVW